MNLHQAEQFRLKKRSDGATSDGCTFAPEIGTPCCETHDYLRRYRPTDPDTGKPITPLRADNLLFQCVLNKGKGIRKLGYFIFASLYWTASRVAKFLGLYR